LAALNKQIKIIGSAAAGLLILIFLAAPVSAAMSARDVFAFFKGGTRVTDNTVLVRWGARGDTRIDICRDGVFVRPQQTAPLSFRIFRLAKAPMIRSLWHKKSRSFSAAQASAYHDYLVEKAEKALDSLTIAMGSATDRTLYSPKDKDEAIPRDRLFGVELETGKVRQIGPDGAWPETSAQGQEKMRPVQGQVMAVKPGYRLVLSLPSARGIGPGSLARVFTRQSANGMAAVAGIWKVETLSHRQDIEALPVHVSCAPQAFGWVGISAPGDFSAFKKKAEDFASSGRRHEAKKEYRKAAKSYTKAAHLGHTPAMVRLGDMILMGRILPKDHKQAVSWYRKAARQDSPAGTACLARMAAKGLGMAKDLDMAVFLYHRAAGRDSPEAQYDLGVIYYHGMGVKRDDAKAIHWFEKAADHRIKEAWFALGVIHETGRGAPVNLSRAKACYKKAAEQGDKRAPKKLADLEKGAPDPGQGKKEQAPGPGVSESE